MTAHRPARAGRNRSPVTARQWAEVSVRRPRLQYRGKVRPDELPDRASSAAALRRVRLRRRGPSNCDTVCGSGSAGSSEAACSTVISEVIDSANSSINANSSRCFARCRRQFVVRDRLIRCRRDQRNEANIRAVTHALQHHVVAPDRRLDAALNQRAAARIVKAGLGEISKTKQRSRGLAGADQRAVAGEGGDRRIDAVDQTLQPLRQRHRAADVFGGGHQDTLAAVGKIKPRAAAGHEHAGRRAEPAQPFQPGRAVQRQRPCKSRHLTPVRIRRAEQFPGQCGATGGAEYSGADRIGPQHLRAVDRPQPCRESARCMYRQPRITDASQLKFRVIHCRDMTGQLAVARRWRPISAARQMTALTER